jgi:membrane-bound lytic murein transglycosylase
MPQPAAKPLQAARWSELPGWNEDELVAAWPAFLQSCRALASRPQWPQWKSVCEDSRGLSAPTTTTIRRFFESRFLPWRLTNTDGTTNGLVTGYYEPLLRGSRTRSKPYLQPVLGVPPDLLTIDLGSVLTDLKGMRLRGRLQGNKVVPYFSRAEITAQEKDAPDRVLLYVDDAVELFFLQVQGSGRVRLPDGSVVRLAYADQNGHPYHSIGKVLVERGEMTLEQASMASIKQWARANPSRLSELLNANPSYVFFPRTTCQRPRRRRPERRPGRAFDARAQHCRRSPPCASWRTGLPVDQPARLGNTLASSRSGAGYRRRNSRRRARRPVLGVWYSGRQSGRTDEAAGGDVGPSATRRCTKIGTTRRLLLCIAL